MIELLDRGGYSCVVRSEQGEIRCFTKRGVDDLYYLLNHEPWFLSSATVADKIVGKGAAALMIKGAIQELTTHIISQGALELFEKTNILLKFEKCVPYIINRDKTGWCPVEQACKDIDQIEEIIKIIDKRF